MVSKETQNVCRRKAKLLFSFTGVKLRLLTQNIVKEYRFFYKVNSIEKFVDRASVTRIKGELLRFVFIYASPKIFVVNQPGAAGTLLAIYFNFIK